MNHHTTRHPSRRTFLTHAAWAGAALPALLPRLVRAAAAGDKLNIAFVGSAAQARYSIDNTRQENFVAFADVDANHLAQAKADFPAAAFYTDYRVMFDKEQKNIDAVVVATPDHHHAQAGLRALALGKHLYCEKPLAHTLREVRLMIEAAQRQKVATQMGTQIHAEDNYRRVVEKIQAGAIGPVREVQVWIYGGNYVGAAIPSQMYDVPTTLDWDLWQGPAPVRDYKPKIYHPFFWRGWWDFGGGGLSDLGCHYMDLPHWALALTHPTAVECVGSEPTPLRAPGALMVTYHHPARGQLPAVKLTWHMGGTHVDRMNVFDKYKLPLDEKGKPAWKGNGILFVGDKGMLLADYSNHVLLPEEQFKDYQAPPQTIPASIGHHNEWIKACKDGSPTTCNFQYSGTLTESVLLGLAAHRAGNIKIEFDPKALKITNSPAANAFLTKEYRRGWEIQKLV